MVCGGTLAGGTVIPGNGNIFASIGCGSHSAFVPEIGDVLMQHVTEAALAWQVRRPLPQGSASCAFPLVQVNRLLLPVRLALAKKREGD